MRVFPGSVDATKSGSGLLKLQKYQADSVNVCQHILFQFNLQALSLFQKPNLQSSDQVPEKLRETHPRDESWPGHPGTEPLHAAHTEDTLMYSVFSHFSFSCLHLLQHFTVWEALHGTDFLPDAEHPQLQLLPEATKVPNPSAEGSATPSRDCFSF